MLACFVAVQYLINFLLRKLRRSIFKLISLSNSVEAEVMSMKSILPADQAILDSTRLQTFPSNIITLKKGL